MNSEQIRQIIELIQALIGFEIIILIFLAFYLKVISSIKSLIQDYLARKQIHQQNTEDFQIKHLILVVHSEE